MRASNITNKNVIKLLFKENDKWNTFTF
jgi:hypothetical protein